MSYVQLIPVLHQPGKFTWMNLQLVKIDVQLTAKFIFSCEKPRFQLWETLNQDREALHDRTAADRLLAHILGIRLKERRYMNLNTSQPVSPRLSCELIRLWNWKDLAYSGKEYGDKILLIRERSIEKLSWRVKKNVAPAFLLVTVRN